MDPAPSDAVPPRLEVRGARASSVIVQRIPPEAAETFLEWQRGITNAAAQVPGYQATEIYPPADKRDEWVVIIHFDDPQTLRAWLDSPRRADWIAKFPCENRDFRLKLLPSGFGSWFAGLDREGAPLPHWKMILAVLLGLYPTVLLLIIFLSPYTARFGTAVAMLIGNAVSVAFLEWLGMPIITWFIGPWLRANGKEDRTLSVVGLVLILAALGIMTLLFRQIVG